MCSVVCYVLSVTTCYMLCVTTGLSLMYFTPYVHYTIIVLHYLLQLLVCITCILYPFVFAIFTV
jgi:hypothetical protein